MIGESLRNRSRQQADTSDRESRQGGRAARQAAPSTNFETRHVLPARAAAVDERKGVRFDELLQPGERNEIAVADSLGNTDHAPGP